MENDKENKDQEQKGFSKNHRYKKGFGYYGKNKGNGIHMKKKGKKAKQ